MPPWAISTFEWSKEWLPLFLNSNFVTSLIGAGAGAWAGAYAAQRIASRAKSRDEMLNEIRNTAAAFNLAVMIFNLCVTLKGQHIKRLKETYDEKKAELLECIGMRDAGTLPAGTIFEFAADFQTLMPLTTPVDKLENIIVERITNRRRSVMFSATLSQIMHYLNGAITERNALIEEFRKGSPHSQLDLFKFYFALPDQSGNTDDRYGSIVNAIFRYTDDCIFFSQEIADDLSAHGKKVEKSFESKFGLKAASVGRLIVKEEQRELLPNTNEYSSWDGVRSE